MHPEKTNAFTPKTLALWITGFIVLLALGAFAVVEIPIGPSSSLSMDSSDRPASQSGEPQFEESRYGESRSVEKLTVDQNQPKASIDDIKARLSPERRGRFEEALSHLITHHMLKLESVDLEVAVDATYDRLDGMTASEIISLADSIEATEN